ncbi:hypothetical protein [Salinibacterium sp. PAMC 21357]|uniref:hypothetical protein n=1 Tax=Salinibacterium sp. PAMC 21357 TaxID=1112215 RepID=UPI0002891D26|nr:hypothetical protein [Salinibacterium sp. PAMC 21357]
MHSRAMRVLRGSAAAFFATLAAALSHLFAGGVSPSLFGMAISLVISVAVCTLLAGRTVSLARLTVAIVVSQTLYHTLFSTMLAPDGIARHDMSLMSANFSSVTQSAGSVMSLSHLGAAVVTIIMFRYAEVAFWGLLTTARLFLARLLTPVVAIAVRTARVPLPEQVLHLAPFASRFLSTMRYRGPPVATTAA